MRIRLGQLRRLIRESLETSGTSGAPKEDLAAFRAVGRPSSIKLVIYDAAALTSPQAELKLASGSKVFQDFVRTTARGIVWIHDPNYGMLKRGPCRGAWEVITSYYPGKGELLYKLAFALSPTGLLMSDRAEVSRGAQSRWRKISDTHSGLPLDDMEHPPGHDNHTDDPEDDCVVLSGDGMKYLNYAYKADGTEGALLKTLEDRHAEVLEHPTFADIDFMSEVGDFLDEYIQFRFDSFSAS